MPELPIDLEKLNITPGVSMLSVLQHLNYKSWYALAEFVDNSIQSFLYHQQELEQLHGDGVACCVDIQLDPSDGGRIVIRDNAAGIHAADYARAFRPAQLPPDRSGLCEFGMGMKSAACWFAPTWTVRTSALGEPNERRVTFDIARIVTDDLDELDVEVRPVAEETHYTEIILPRLHNRPQTRTIVKIKEHLSSIYRVFIRSGILRLTFNGELLRHDQPDVLIAPHAADPDGEPVTWSKEINFDFGGGLSVKGFAAIRRVASTSGAGFALFRRNRVIQGSGDETYRPEFIFGKPNTFVYQRLFGELHLDGFEISHTKDGFLWDADEEPFLELLKDHLDESPLPLLRQARQHRARPDRNALEQGAAQAVQRTAQTMERELPPVIERQLHEEPEDLAPPAELREARNLAAREMTVEFGDCLWRVRIELTYDPAVGDWVDIADSPSPVRDRTGRTSRAIVIRLSLEHPFMQMFGGVDPESIEPLLRVAVAICLAEITSRDAGVTGVSHVRRNINDLLRNALAEPADN